MKTVSLVLIVATLFDVGCRRAPNAPPKEESGQSRDLDLQHKIACKQFESSEESNASREVTGYMIVDSVFYSPKKNSCLVAKHKLWYPQYAGGREPEDLEIDDVLGGKQVFYQHLDTAQDAATISVLMDRQIAKLE